MSVSETLVPFGFTALESEIYVFLLKLSPATGYRIAQGISKPAANTYKAIQSLQQKGAILVEDGPSRLCRAVPLKELMNRLQKDFDAQRKSAEKRLKSIEQSTEDTRIYQLLSREQILNRFREMLSSASQSIIFKLSSEAILAVEGDIERATERGVVIWGIANEPVDVAGVEVVVAMDADIGSITAISDSSQLLTGVIREDTESEAIWTRNEALSRNTFVSLAAEFSLAQINALLVADEKKGRMLRAIENRPKLS